MKLSVNKKISVRFNKVVKQIYLFYRNNVMKEYTDPKSIYVQGNSDVYSGTVVIPAFKLSKRGFILTRVNEHNDLIAVYILNNEDARNYGHWIKKEYEINHETSEPETFWFLQFKYNQIDKFKSNLLLNYVNEYFNRIENK